MGFGGSSDALRAERKVANAESGNIQVAMESFGGPVAFENAEAWKSGLVENRNTWAVISKGSLSDFIPVWELITISHRDDFDMAGQLSDFLSDVFDLAKKATIEQSVIHKVALDEVERQLLTFEKVFESASKWKLEDAEHQLQNLFLLKKDVLLSSNGIHVKMGSAVNSHLVKNFVENLGGSRPLDGSIIQSLTKNEPNLFSEGHLGPFQSKRCGPFLQEFSAETLQVIATTLDQELIPKVVPFYNEKTAFINHAIKTLNNKQDFSLFQFFFADPVSFLRDLLEDILSKTLFEEESPKLQVLDPFKWGVDLVEANIAAEILKSQDRDFPAWIQYVSEALTQKFKITSLKDLVEEVTPGHNTTNLQEIKSHLIRRLSFHCEVLINQMRVGSRIHKEKLVQGLIEKSWPSLMGCLALCPFCKAICSHKVKGHKGNHFSLFHKPCGFIGLRVDGNKGHLERHSCPELVQSAEKMYTDPERTEVRFLFSEYSKQGEMYSSWTFEASGNSPAIWDTFLAKFTKSLEMKYGASFGIPPEAEGEEKGMNWNGSSSWQEKSFFLSQM